MKSVTRLYKSFQPEHYDLTIRIDPEPMAFTGTVVVRGKKAGRPAQRLTFHQRGLHIDSAKVVKRDKKGTREISLSRINNQDSLHEVRLHSDELLYPGSYEVTMSFHAPIRRGMTGLYPCFFKVDGHEHVMFATQFESHHARELFPCVDEPEAKATFDLTLVTPAGQIVLSNTPIKSQSREPEADSEGSQPLLKDVRLRTMFETTPRMSTYLVAFVIGELHAKSTKTARGTDVSVWATIAQPAESLDFALDAAKKSVEFFESYFGVNYPLAKADHVALPDFSSGAMENWGLITYRERVLLAYPRASQSTKEVIATVIAHETSHQWFGNLVTMKWWDDLWLNESFANMMEYQAVDAMFPEWHIWDMFTLQEGLSSLRRDAVPGVQPVKVAVHHPDEISTLFDPYIVYAKGGRLLNMLRNYVGDDVFRKGLGIYFRRHAYGNTTGHDLWQALGEASGRDIAAFMDLWLERSGFPVVFVNQQGRALALSQSHFLENGEVSDSRVWPVPLFSNHPELPDALAKASLHRLLASDTPLVLNQGSAGQYIVNYTQPEHRAYLLGLVQNMSLPISDRLMLLNSAGMLAKAGYQSFADVLNLLSTYRHEQTEAVWGIISVIIGEARRFIDHDGAIEELIKAYVRKLVTPEYGRLGWEEKPDESASDRKLRATIIGIGAWAEKPAIIEGALRRFKEYQSSPDSNSERVSTELRSIIFSVPVRQETPGAFDYLLRVHDHTANSDLKADITAALCTTRNEGEAGRLLIRLKDASLVKPQDADHWLAYLLRNRPSRVAAWHWMTFNWGWIAKTYAHDKSYDDFPRFAAGACNTREWAQKYADFFKPKESEVALRRNVQIGLAEIATRIKWLERDLGPVREFFKQ